MLANALVIGASLLAQISFGWTTGGVTVGPHPSALPRAAADGSGGAFIEWYSSATAATRPDVLGQHLGPTGEFVGAWPPLGLPIAATSRDEDPECVARDDGGGSFWLWLLNETDLGLGYSYYLTRRLADGSVAAGWPLAGVRVKAPQTNGVNTFLYNSGMVPDGQGGVLIAWEEQDPEPTWGTARAIRVLPNGTFAPGWPDTGVVLGLPKNIPGEFVRKVIPDGAGGGFFVWLDGRTHDPNLAYSARAYVQRLTASGAPAPGWPATGLRVGPAATATDPVGAMSDGHGGIFIAWEDYREGPPSPGSIVYGDVYLQHLTGDGSVAAGWPQDGMPIHTGPGAQWYPQVCTDGEDGVMLTWEDYNSGRIWVMRVTSTGAPAPGWPAGGKVAATPPGYSDPPALVSDGNGGMYVGWIQGGNSDRAYVQHVLHDGSFAPGFGISGTLLVDVASTSQTDITLVESEPGNAIAVWKNRESVPVVRNTIRAQKLVSGGLVATALALESSTADANGVHLRWSGTHSTGTEYFVERSPEGFEWSRIGTARVSNDDALTYDDASAQPGSNLAYRLVDASSRVIVPAVWVAVPQRFQFALAGAQPNPTRAASLTVQFTLAVQSAGRLEVFDMAGRRVLARDIGALTAGQHTLALPEAASLSPGVHWLRLRQGDRSATRRVVLTK